MLCKALQNANVLPRRGSDTRRPASGAKPHPANRQNRTLWCVRRGLRDLRLRADARRYTGACMPPASGPYQTLDCRHVYSPKHERHWRRTL